MEKIYIQIPEGWGVKFENGRVIISPPQNELSKIRIFDDGNPDDGDINKKKDEHLYLQKIALELYLRHYRLPNLNKKLRQQDYYSYIYHLSKETGRSPCEIAEEMLREAQEKNGRV